MATPAERLASIPEYNNAVEYLLAGASPTVLPRSIRSYLRVQEYLIRPESLVSIDTIRAYRDNDPIRPSMFGPALGLGGYLAFTRSEIDHQGYGLFLPKIAGIYSQDQTIIKPLSPAEAVDIKNRLDKFFLGSANYPVPLKQLIIKKSGFQAI